MRRLFDELAERGTRILRTRAVRRALASALRRAWWILPAVPLTILALQGFRALAGTSDWAPHWIVLLLVTLAVPGIPVLRAMWGARRRPVDRRAALGLFDGAVEAEERLVTADELMALSAPTGFVEAVLEDAAGFLGRARASNPTFPPSPSGRGPLALASAAVTIVLLACVILLGGNPFHVSTEDDWIPRSVDTAARPRPVSDDEVRSAPREPSDPTRPDGLRANLDSEEPDARAAGAPDRLPREMRRKEGRTGSGRSSHAEASRGEGDARGSPTNQGQTTAKPKTKRRMQSPKKKKAAPPPGAEEAEKSAGDESGSTTGRGSSRGSNKNPVATDWRSKDQVTTDEEDEIEDDEEIEDEEVDSEARGGVQPTLRDRKPPVSRDLSIGFGNRPNPNANGRGGASQPKKSRGTASLVLGVPIPDRVKGRPNPGKTKVTQERVEPRRENAPALPAQERTPRTGPSGPLAQPQITPWMRDLIRDYFLSLRSEALRTQEKEVR